MNFFNYTGKRRKKQMFEVIISSAAPPAQAGRKKVLPSLPAQAGKARQVLI